MKIIPQQPIYKPRKDTTTDRGKDPAYMELVAQLGCVACETHREVQNSPTTVHHVIHDRYSTRKAPDRDTIPLCDGHHQGDFDTSKLAIHRGKEKWRDRYGPDYSYIPATRAAVAAMMGEVDY